MFNGVARWCVCGVVAVAGAAPAAGQAWQDDFAWTTVGVPGNRPATAAEAPMFGIINPLFPPLGSVDYEYRISKTPVTVSQWQEFVQAYAPYTSDSSEAFTSSWMFRDSEGNLHGPNPSTLNYPVGPSFRYAARFTNWLHNGKVNEQWAFETGVYDTSTFTNNPDGTFNDQSVPSEGATVWIPSLNEWTKAFHYDPDKNGPGQDGYWLYPHSSDVAPIPGLP